MTPLVSTRVTTNHLTTLRLLIGVAGAFYLAQGTFLVVLSNFVDYIDGELARISGKTSRIGHFYNLATDAMVTILLFVSMGYGLGIAGVAVAVIFFLRMRIREIAGKAGTHQAFVGGFETEDVLYLLQLVTLTGVVSPFVVVASIDAPLFAVWVVLDYWRVTRRTRIGKETN